MYETQATHTQYPDELKESPPNVTIALSEEVKRLCEVIDFGETKLANVLAPEYAGPNERDNAPAPLTSPIKGVEMNLAAAVTRLRLLLERVEA